jgi:hypothetical protein
MIIANFFYIQNTNGLFYYGAEYIRANRTLVRKVLVKPSMFTATSRVFPELEILPCTSIKMFLQVIIGTSKGDIIFTPTPHPLPGISNQWVTLHDIYPFEGGGGKLIKRWLFFLSLATSKCSVGYINESEALPFLLSGGISKRRLVFSPNKFPTSFELERKNHSKGISRLVIALVGTDSTKKNYHILFDEILKAGAERRLKFLIYGHYNDYIKSIFKAYPTMDVSLILSDDIEILDFLNDADVLLSVAKGEGFGRPVAVALLSGIPCYLINSPVFCEFYSGAAFIFNDVQSLVQKLLQVSAENAFPFVAYSPPPRAVLAHGSAIKTLQTRGIGV